MPRTAEPVSQLEVGPLVRTNRLPGGIVSGDHRFLSGEISDVMCDFASLNPQRRAVGLPARRNRAAHQNAVVCGSPYRAHRSPPLEKSVGTAPRGSLSLRRLALAAVRALGTLPRPSAATHPSQSGFSTRLARSSYQNPRVSVLGQRCCLPRNDSRKAVNRHPWIRRARAWRC